MDNKDNILFKAYNLINENKLNDAAKCVFESEVKTNAYKYINLKYQKLNDQTDIIFTDAYLLFEHYIKDKLINEKIVESKKFYGLLINLIKKICNSKTYELLKNLNNIELNVNITDSIINMYENYYDIKFKEKIKLNIDEYEGDFKYAIRAFSLLSNNCKKLIKLKYVWDFKYKDIYKLKKNYKNDTVIKSRVKYCMDQWRKYFIDIKTMKTENE